MSISPLAEYYIWFTSCFGFTGRAWDIISQFSSVKEAYFSVKENSSDFDFISVDERKNITYANIDYARNIVSYCEERDIGIVCFDDVDYPEALKSVYNPPCHLFYRGDISCVQNGLVLAVVGTRVPSDYSKAVTTKLIKQILPYGVTVASGFARGIDITAHSACFENGGKTIAVLGCGVDFNYPVENAEFRKSIIENGVMISEYYPNSKPTSFSFPQRNRILSGISSGTIVIEAGEKSGSLITANLALSQGKDIFCIPPHNIFDKRYFGNSELLRDGAVPIFSKQDILYEYFENYSHKLTETTLPYRNITINEDENLPQQTVESVVEVKKAYDYSELPENDMLIVKVLQQAELPLIADEISQLANLDISETLMLLTDLELEGIVELKNGQSYTLK